VRAHLERIERSVAFAKAERLRTFLRFVVETTCAGEAHTLKEYSIALAVCARPPSFDPKVDPIVRVDANRLRARLEAYYSVEGRDDELRIQLPKGTYVPTFTPIEKGGEARPRASLVVLPFLSVGPHADAESFTDGLTEELIHQLSLIPGLRVIARTSAFQYRGKGGDLPRIASDLGVDHVVEGSVRWAGDRLRATAQLTDVHACSVRWSEQYDRGLADVFALQDDICRNIARALRMQLVDVTRASRPSADSRAHVEYQRSVLGRLLDAIHHEHLHRPAGWLELQSELIFQRRKQ